MSGRFFQNKYFQKINGFTLVEVVVATGVFLLFAIGIYSGITTVFKVTQESRRKILETAMLNEQIEVARNLKYEDVGILAGSPPGKLPYEKTITRNGTTFKITTTVRNIDDPYDGTVNGSTKDLAPADYKLVEMSIVCTSCSQSKPLILTTRIAPKNLENTTNNGSLFIHVFDAAGLPVSGASVNVLNTAPNPDVVINDVTDAQGMLRLIDVPTGTLSNHITVTKNGYASDYTVSTTIANPAPWRPPATVISQTVTEISFSIDKTSVLNLNTLRTNCQAQPSGVLRVWGQKLIGTNPKIYKLDQNITTSGQGLYSFPTIEEDTYTISASGTAYDIAGVIPGNPFKIIPNSTLDASVILRAHTANSLLVSVLDAGTKLPLSDATVELTGTSYSKQLTTTLGYIRQTDWSGGGNQADFVDESRFWYEDGGLDRNSPVGDVKLKKFGGNYIAQGNLESSTFDIGSGVTFRTIIFEPTAQPPQAGPNSVRVQLATSPTQNPATWNFVGPNGTTSTFYTPTTTQIYSGHNGDKFLRYKLFLSTANDTYTPQLSELSVTFTNNCTPPGQVFFYNLPGQGTYTLTVNRTGYTAATGQLDIKGNMETTVEMSPL